MNALQDYKEGKFYYGTDISGDEISTLVFDDEQMYLVGYGETKVFVMNLMKPKVKRYNIDAHLFEKILHLRFESNSS